MAIFMNTLKDAFDLVGGVSVVADAVKRSERAVYKWLEKNQLPRSEYTGETNYCEAIADCSKGALTKMQILNLGRPMNAALKAH